MAATRRQPGGEAYVAAMFAAYGPQRGSELIAVHGDPHLGVFPNLQLITQHVRVIVPVAVDRTDVYLYPVHFGGVSHEMNEKRLRKHEEFSGPAGMGQPDDTEMFERNTDGLQAVVDPWMDLSRGRHRERVDADGSIIGHITRRGHAARPIAGMGPLDERIVTTTKLKRAGRLPGSLRVCVLLVRAQRLLGGAPAGFGCCARCSRCCSGFPGR